ncbi:MAG: hypothetical protein WDZ73_01695 [Candidatus Paceibacterota bacterium]
MLLDHHAYIHVGSLSLLKSFLQPHLKLVTGGVNFNHPAVWVGEFELLTAENSRAIKTASRVKKILIIKFNSATAAAQNALLKTLEEPASGVKLFLIVPNVKILLPTILSRLEILHTNLKSSSDDLDPNSPEAILFLQASVADRLLLIDKWKKDEPEINKIRTRKIVEQVELYLWRQETFTNLGVILNIKKYLYDHALNFRLTLVYLALALPSKLS